MRKTHLTEVTICAVFVTYYPQKEMIDRAIGALHSQVDKIVVVDNTPVDHDGVVQKILDRPVEKILLRENRGIAAGHNIGIAWARRHGFSHVLLMDQDSIAAPDMVERLIEASVMLRTDGKKVAAVGPNIIEPRFGLPLPFIEQLKGFIRRISCQNDEYIRVVHIISSGSLIHMEILDEIGDMEEGLFIDSVDIEWGLRAMYKGFHCYGVCSARLHHRLGDTSVSPSLLGKRQVLVHGSVRYYYQYRNAITLCKRPYASIGWILDNFLRHSLKFIIFLLVVPHRFKNASMMLQGTWHALIGVNGPYRNGSSSKK